jgi:CHAD domain-containing protein
LRYRHGDGWTVKLPQPPPHGGEASYRTEHTFDGPAHAVPADALRLVRGLLRHAHVDVVAELRTLRTSRKVGLDDRRIAEIVEDDVHVVRSTCELGRFRQVEIELTKDAPDDALDALCAGLRRYGAGEPNPVPKIVFALGADATEDELRSPPVDADCAGADVARAALAGSVKRLVATDPLLRADMQADAVHDARVAVRRLRSDLRTFEPLFEAEWALDLRSRLRRLGGVLGAARDADVLLEEVAGYESSLPEIDRREVPDGIERLHADRNRTYRDVSAHLSEPQYIDLLEALVRAAQTPQFNARALETARDLTAELYSPVWKALRKRVREAGAMPSDSALHRMRIKAKNARYAAEALAPVCGAEAAKLAACLEALQTALGAQHDAVHACGALRSHATGSAHAFVLGELTAVAHAQSVSRREGWLSIWAESRTQHKRFRRQLATAFARRPGTGH